ncbi:MAG: dihydroneopterin aldolase [Verrucomicrobia bacterium]|nr:dihydroneopterin aldolase [Verrucomicrobiota bacterium]
MRIGFKKLALNCKIGTLTEEKERIQPLFLSLSVSPRLLPAEDALSAAIDYRELVQLCEEIAIGVHHQLLETLALKIREALIRTFPITSLSLLIEKPEALPSADCAFVEVSWDGA